MRLRAWLLAVLLPLVVGQAQDKKQPAVAQAGKGSISAPPASLPLTRVQVLELRNLELTITLLQREYQDAQAAICQEAGIELAKCRIDAKAQTPVVFRMETPPAPPDAPTAKEAKK